MRLLQRELKKQAREAGHYWLADLVEKAFPQSDLEVDTIDYVDTWIIRVPKYSDPRNWPEVTVFMPDDGPVTFRIVYPDGSVVESE